MGDHGLDPAEEAVRRRHISGRSVASWRGQIRPDADRNLQCGQRRPEPRARRGFQADGGGRRSRVARWLGQGHGLRPATRGRRPDAAAADGVGGRRGVRPPDRGPLSWPAEALPRPGANPRLCRGALHPWRLPAVRPARHQRPRSRREGVADRLGPLIEDEGQLPRPAVRRLQLRPRTRLPHGQPLRSYGTQAIADPPVASRPAVPHRGRASDSRTRGWR